MNLVNFNGCWWYPTNFITGVFEGLFLVWVPLALCNLVLVNTCVLSCGNSWIETRVDALESNQCADQSSPYLPRVFRAKVLYSEVNASIHVLGFESPSHSAFIKARMSVGDAGRLTNQHPNIPQVSVSESNSSPVVGFDGLQLSLIPTMGHAHRNVCRSGSTLCRREGFL